MSQGPLSSLLATGRQWLQPREFRIDDAALPPEGWSAIERWASQPQEAPPDPRKAADERARTRFLADLATGLWRLRRRMLEPGADRPKEPYRREYRHVEAVWDLLAGAGIKVVDHTGQAYDAGQRLEVAGQVETPGLTRARVQETVKPTIYVDGEHVQCGVVLVENPAPS